MSDQKQLEWQRQVIMEEWREQKGAKNGYSGHSQQTKKQHQEN